VKRFISVVLVLMVIASAGVAVELTVAQRKELIVFALLSMGAAASVADVKDPLTDAEVHKLVATGLNLNGLLCAKVLTLTPLKLPSKYEAKCIAYRGGEGTKMYVIEALAGRAFEQ